MILRERHQKHDSPATPGYGHTQKGKEREKAMKKRHVKVYIICSFSYRSISRREAEGIPYGEMPRGLCSGDGQIEVYRSLREAVKRISKLDFEVRRYCDGWGVSYWELAAWEGMVPSDVRGEDGEIGWLCDNGVGTFIRTSGSKQGWLKAIREAA